MKKLTNALFASLVAALVLFSLPSRAGLMFEASLNGASEVPRSSQAPPGQARFEFSDDLSTLDFELDIFNGVGITQAHLHLAPSGANGPVLAFLFNVAPVPGPGGVDVNGTLAIGTLSDSDVFSVPPVTNIAELAQAFLAGDVYVNVHSEANPSGEVRGQVARVPAPATLALLMLGALGVGFTRRQRAG